MIRRNRRSKKRRGTIIVLAAFMMIVMMAVLAFAIDLGTLYVARGELQRCADASAIAAAWELIDEEALSGGSDPFAIESNARSRASQFARLNPVLLRSPALSREDVQVGYLANPLSASSTMDLSGEHPANAVRVLVRRTREQNGSIGFVFGRALGLDSAGVQVEATAALLDSFGGFQAPSDGSNLGFLPFALDYQTWFKMMEQHVGEDEWTWDSERQRVAPGGDGILEVDLYPHGTGSPGNRGTVDIGGTNNSTADIARQILYGLSANDLEFHGGKLEFDEEGKMYLNGDTGISAGIKDELEAVKGRPSIVPLFDHVESPGDNATYTIVGLAGVRIVRVRLVGPNSQKQVMVQPAIVVTKGGIARPGASNASFVYSPIRLVK